MQGSKVKRCRGEEVKRCRGVEVKRCRGAEEVQNAVCWCSVLVQCGAVVQRSSRGAEVQQRDFRGAVDV